MPVAKERYSASVEEREKMGLAWVQCIGCTKPKPFPENKNTYSEN